MADLKTTYMGLELKNPFIAGASGYTANLDKIKQLEEAGAAAIVTASLFEEQIQYERFRLEEDLHQFDNLYAEMTNFFPQVKHAGPKDHLGWVRKAKEAVGIPVIASLNAVNRGIWSEWALQLEDTGADALELNFYATPNSFEKSSMDVESEQIEILGEIKNKVKIPLSVKLSAFYSNPLYFIKQLDEIGVRGFVLFNRLFQPDINVEEQTNLYRHNLSTGTEYEASLRYAGLLHGNIKGDVCANSGILSGKDAIKLVLAGASCVQVVSTLYKNKISSLANLIKEAASWMDGKGYKELSAFKGKLSATNNQDPGFYRRAQYVKNLIKADYTS
ncbi:MAG: dihydroorotate dehydrogenase-like protein [Spirochaetaceae bacterium]|nr:MAG: dihydroorotate dehydrogenase-like protein [Spirochaetaceae bacterium]